MLPGSAAAALRKESSYGQRFARSRRRRSLPRTQYDSPTCWVSLRLTGSGSNRLAQLASAAVVCGVLVGPGVPCLACPLHQAAPALLATVGSPDRAAAWQAATRRTVWPVPGRFVGIAPVCVTPRLWVTGGPSPSVPGGAWQ